MPEEVKKFRHRCIPILPTVYSDSLSYLEVLSRTSQKLNEVIEFVNGFTDEVLAQANAYTDSKIGGLQTQMNQLRSDTLAFQERITAQILNFQDSTNGQLASFRSEFEQFKTLINTEIGQINDYIELRIEQNNEQLLREISENIGDKFTVLNPFTGQYDTVQDIVFYLADFHMQNAIVINRMVQLDNTVNQMIAYDASCTDWATNGANIMV